MNILKILKKNDFIFFILKRLQTLLKSLIKKIIIFSGLEERVSKIEHSLIHELTSQVFPWQTYCLNGQENRKKIITEILSKIKFDLIVETGTEYGFSTKYFSQYSNKVLSIEKSKPVFLMAKKNLKDEEKIELILNDSKNLDLILKEKKINPESSDSTFFYLDAHADDDYPLIDEISLIFKKFRKFILVIDDFQIPGDEGYGYDSYKGKKLNIKFIKKLLIGNEYIFFPNISSDSETGRLRGYTLITNSINFKEILQNIKELSIFRP
tara:strand:- start:854 stop:1654 length:801 start_codon:yes stop_codon:yes gene_type:complete